MKDRSPAAALRFLDDLNRLKTNLLLFPQMGFRSDELPIPGVLRFTMGDYLIDYEIADDLIEIRAIRHDHQRPPGLQIDDGFDYEDGDPERPKT
ncbi:type II toxin-antitoxin system RelE/ParE family toxin [Rhizobium rhizogenes]|uniref:type II toxin-antitoxin system RelE/ParE family toxin n=1 Tax=Rhizobium rhizogenes TaxID=359 RepID=UPI001F209F5C|nr:type II toxin-antitoxin system RelE/ParE family toxin [Rhizobium rhizogenes]